MMGLRDCLAVTVQLIQAIVVVCLSAVTLNLLMCWRIKKEFHCPLCLDKNPSLDKLLLGEVSRPSECNHYGCTSCMKNWLSSTRYNGCPLCRKESKTIINFSADMYGIEQLAYVILYSLLFMMSINFVWVFNDVGCRDFWCLRLCYCVLILMPCLMWL